MNAVWPLIGCLAVAGMMEKDSAFFELRPAASVMLPAASPAALPGRLNPPLPVLSLTGTNRVVVNPRLRTSKEALLSGVCIVEPYSMLMLAPGGQIDAAMVVRPEGDSFLMPVIRPELRFVPRDKLERRH